MKTIVSLTLFFLCLSTSVFAQKSSSDFVFTIKTDNPGVTNDYSYLLTLDSTLLHPNINYNVDIDWNDDGVFDTLNVNSTLTHQYSSIGTYSIRLRGSFPYLRFGRLGVSAYSDASKLITVDQWGSQAWKNCSRMFDECDSLTLLPLDTPDFSMGPSLFAMFAGCNSFNGVVNHWNVSSVTDMGFMFYGAINFNQPLNNLNVSSVNNMKFMFKNASNFNHPINNWNVSNVSNIEEMFCGASSFNQPLDSWDVSNLYSLNGVFYEASSFNQSLNSWDVSNVNEMISTLLRASSFNQPLNNWDVSNVRIIINMFSGASNFDQSFTNWNFSSAISLGGFLDSSAMSKANYDSLLMHLQNNYLSKNLTLGAKGLNYCAADSVRTLLINNGWTINGDSLNCQTVDIEQQVLEESEISLYPNPASDNLEINFTITESRRLRIYNVQGLLVKEQMVSESKTSIDVSDFANGVYFLDVGEHSKRFVVQH